MKSIFTFLILLIFLFASAQKSDFQLSFTALDNITYVKLDSIKIVNRSQGNSYMLYWPDTSILLNNNTGDHYLFIGYVTYDPVWTGEYLTLNSELQLSQNFPNPVKGTSSFNINLPDEGVVNIAIASITGKIEYASSFDLCKGLHNFKFKPGTSQYYILTAEWKGSVQSIKIISQKYFNNNCSVEYAGKVNAISTTTVKTAGDIIVKESGIYDIPSSSGTYTFQFTDNIPCPGVPTVEYGGQVYNTVQILSQCWLKENLNIGTMIQGNESMTDNGIIEKFCFDNKEDSCIKYGGLYEWNEMMQYLNMQGTQGICPPGWHIPADEEWKILEGAVDSLYGIGNPVWDLEGHDRGFDAGFSIRSNSGWYNGYNSNDVFGFNALPAGNRVYPGSFILNTKSTIWWSSDSKDIDKAWYHGANFGYTGADRDFLDQYIIGASVRCLKD